MEVNSSMVGIVFWVAIAVIVFINVWGKRSAERERQLTLRTAIERGQQIDPAMIEKIMAGQQKPKQSQFGLLIGGVVVSFAGVGLVLMGLILGAEDPEALKGLLGSGVLVAMVGVGLVVAHVLQRRLQAAAPSPTDPAA
jgi:hypothetical protein